MTINGLLPIGTVVLLKNSTKRVMITGVAQVSSEDNSDVYDYIGVLYPEGYMSPDKNYLFNRDQIDKLYFIGYQDDEGLQFKEKADTLLGQIRAEKADK